jgi:hypothetical protein
MSTPVTIGTLPQGFCPATYQTMLDGFGAALSVDIPSASGITISATKPSSTSNIWFQIDSLGRFIRTYIFGQGTWLSAHPMAPGLTTWWFAALPNFTTFDGGDGSAVGAAAGPMWQQAKDSNGNVIAAKFPIPAGTLPSSLAIALGDTGGLETYTIANANLPLYKPKTPIIVSSDSGSNLDKTWEDLNGYDSIAGTNYCVNVTGSTHTPLMHPFLASYGQTTPTALNLMNPYVVGYLIQRTARIFYSIA